MRQKIRVGILCGGKSAEHEVSLLSAKNVLEAIDRDAYEVVLIGIDKSGVWYHLTNSPYLLNEDDPKRIALNIVIGEKVTFAPQSRGVLTLLGGEKDVSVDVVFPILHGPFGEDGTVQGLLAIADIPCVGAGVLGSAVGMDKDIMKRLLRDAGIPTAKFLVLNAGDQIDIDTVVNDFGLPLFVKPANLGSSVGVHKVIEKKDLKKTIKDAFSFDSKVLIEECIVGREVECAVLGNQNPKASVIGEIIPQHDFYSYEAKYIDGKAATLVAPAVISEEIMERIQDLSILTFKTLSCRGLGRVDCFLKDDGTILVNEINTIPGFTKISMYPRLWELSGLSYKDLISRLIELALEQHKNQESLAVS